MKFTFNWLKEFVAVDLQPEKIGELLTMAGLELESLTAIRDPDGQQDWVFEIGVTPNRGDCLGIRGIAREVSALTGTPLQIPPLEPHGKDSTVLKRASIEIADRTLCARYSARIVDGLTIHAAPPLVRFRLEASGIRPINNIVDVTNYVMLETGQPLHAFDLDRLPVRKINVRAANETRKFTTLDGVERELAAEDLLICDGEVPVALAGIMGGLDSEVRDQTRSVLLESANFDPRTIRRTAKRLGLHSEASHRFERGVDPEGTVTALDRAAYLLAQVAGGQPSQGVADRYVRRLKPPTILLRESRIQELLGLRLDLAVAEKSLQALGLKTRRRGKSARIEVVPPSFRPDLTREADLIEELARIQGYGTIPSTLPRSRPSGRRTDYRLGSERRLRSFLSGEGLSEAINLPFTTEEMNELFGGLWPAGSTPVTVLNPLEKDNAQMRLSLLPGLLATVKLNLAQKAQSVAVYQLGKTYRLSSEGNTEERHSLAAVFHGPRRRLGLHDGDRSPPRSFLDCKGIVEGILDLFRVLQDVAWSETAAPCLHPGRATSVQLQNQNIGHLGQIHPALEDQLEVSQLCVVELDFDKLLEYAPRQINARSLPRFPSVERDFAVVVNREFPSQQIIHWIANLDKALIERVEVFDEYLGSSIPEGKKSLAYKVIYRAQDRTLTDSEINTLHQSVVEQIGKVFGAQLRT
ncbi:MAG TPA: phenylalanine--tRNA ligase subunit beta [Candidatus Binatia bacterium]|jgi:phenylalanyl-tRNA synthetase beta chain